MIIRVNLLPADSDDTLERNEAWTLIYEMILTSKAQHAKTP